MTTTLDAYQEAALRSARGTDGTLPTREYLALGLCSESGEVAGLIKKFTRHGKPFDADAVADELGDVLWYVATLATLCGLSLSDVADRNLDKLRRRYPEGFQPAGGGADADRAAAARASSDHSADADKVVAPEPLHPDGEHQALPAPRPQDDGVRCTEWRSNPPYAFFRSIEMWHANGHIACVAEPRGAWEAYAMDGTGDSFRHSEGFEEPESEERLEAAQLAAETWLRERHPYFDADWPGRHGNTPAPSKAGFPPSKTQDGRGKP